MSTSLSQAILEPSKARFVGADSAIAFPMSLAKDMGSHGPLRLHSYAWNVGVRSEQQYDIDTKIVSLLLWNDVQTYSNIYFNIVHPIFGVFEREAYEQRCTQHWSGNTQSLGFEAMVGGVCTLGSIFADASSCRVESQLAGHTKSILENTSMMHSPSQDHVIAWILRCVYLRLTTRPHASWMASGVTMHVAEAIGLHRELDGVCIASRSSAVSALTGKELENRRKVFWVAWSLNRIFSAEYSRSAAFINNIDCAEPTSTDKDYISRLIWLAKIGSTTFLSDADSLEDALTKLSQQQDRDKFLVLLNANVAFTVFRKLRILQKGGNRDRTRKILAIGDASLAAARSSAADRLVWWDILSVPFHYVCILLSIDSLESLASLSHALQTLEDVANHLQTHMAQEALQTAKLLVEISFRRKQKVLDLLSPHVRDPTSFSRNPDTQMSSEHFHIEAPLSAWLDENYSDLDQFIDASLEQF